MRVSISDIPRTLRPVKRMGSGNSPRSLSPITGIWRPAPPAECRWLPVSRRCAGPAWTIANRCGPAAEPARGVATAGVSGEASQPGACTPAGALPPNPARTHLRWCPRTTSARSAPRHRAGSLALRHGSCLLPLKLPSLLSRTTPFSVPPDHRILSLIRGHRRPSGAFRTDRSIRDDPSLFPIPVATPEPCSGLFCSSKTAGRWITTLARSSNFRSLTDCVRPRGPKPRSLGRHSASQLVSAVRTTSLVASRTAAAHRLTSWLLSRRDTTPSEEAGDMCLKGGPHSE